MKLESGALRAGLQGDFTCTAEGFILLDPGHRVQDEVRQQKGELPQKCTPQDQFTGWRGELSAC